ELAPDDLGLVEVEAVAGAARAADERAAARPLELADVADLAAALGVEGRAVQHHDAGVALAQDVDLAALAHDADYRRLGVERFVPDELGLAGALGDRAQRVGALGEQAPLADVAARGAPRLLPRGLVAGAVDGDAALGGQLLGEVEGEAVRLPQVERDVARQHLALELGQQVADALDAGLERAEELLLLGLDDAHHAVPTVDDLGVGLAHRRDDLVDEAVEDRVAQAQQPGVARGAAYQHLHDVAGAVVRGQHAVGDREGHGPDVVGDHAVGERRGALVRPARELRHPADRRLEQLGAV